MRENHGHLPVNLDIAAFMKLLNGIRTVEWASQFLVTVKKDIIQRLIL